MNLLLKEDGKQEGYTVLGLVLAVAIMGVITAQFTERLEHELITQAETATVNDMTQLARAQLSHRWENSDWARKPADLFRHFRNVNGVGEPYKFDFVPGSPLFIITRMRAEGSARRVAQRLGSFAKLALDQETDEMTLVRAEYAVPLGTLASLNDEYLRRDGANDAFGDLHFRRGAQADIMMNGNRIEGASRITARTSAHLGLVNADLGAFDTLTVQHFRYKTPEDTP